MSPDDCFKFSNLLNLANAIQHKVASPYGLHVDANNRRATIRAFLNLSHDSISTGISAHCVIAVYDDWAFCQPDIRCLEYWVKRDVDWHVYGDGTLCYDLDLRWRELVSKVLKSDGIRVASNFAAEWCLHHSKSLLWKHYDAYVNNIDAWRSDWPAWGHGETGRKEYAKEQLLKRIDRYGR